VQPAVCGLQDKEHECSVTNPVQQLENLPWQKVLTQGMHMGPPTTAHATWFQDLGDTQGMHHEQATSKRAYSSARIQDSLVSASKCSPRLVGGWAPIAECAAAAALCALAG
jgi:hypothetical protein